MESLAMNHPFVDGNKRTALDATDTFLGLNGYFIDCDSRQAYDHFMGLFETHSFRFAELSAWLEEHVKPLPGVYGVLLKFAPVEKPKPAYPPTQWTAQILCTQLVPPATRPRQFSSTA